MSRSHGSLVAARARPQVAAHALLDLVASASCLSPTQTPSQTHRTQQLEEQLRATNLKVASFFPPTYNLSTSPSIPTYTT